MDSTTVAESGSPLPELLRPGFTNETASLQSQRDPRDAPNVVNLEQHDLEKLNISHENRSSSKMLASEKSLATKKGSMPNIRRSVSVPVTEKTKQATAPGHDAGKQQRDGLIMDTNKSSIVSKRSVEKLYYEGEPEFFRHFVTKFKRRSPLINRGYWLRMKAIEHGVSRFLAERTAKRKVVVNLGCGYDPLPWLFLGKQPLLCQGTTFVDVDYPLLMQNKIGIIQKTSQLKTLLPKFTTTGQETGLLASSDPYVAIGCDLADLTPLQDILQDHLQMGNSDVAVLFTSEVSTAYMPLEGSQAVFQWAATFNDVRFCLLEQHLPDGPDHPFAATMLAHFEKLRTPLRAVGTMEQMKQRFVDAGFPEMGTEIRSLWELWSDPTFLSAEERRRLDRIEPFDEWEEFALFGSHYFLLFAEKEPNKDYSNRSYRASRASIFAGSTRGGSFASSPVSGSESPTTPQYHFSPGDILQTHELKEPHDFRRFGAVVPPFQVDSNGDSLGLHGGLGTQERVSTCNTYTRFDKTDEISGPPLRTGLMCHSVTRLGNTANCVLTGGRTSPDNASAESWLRLDGKWRRVHDLPRGRYRHCAVPLVLPTDPRPAHTVLMFGGKTSDGQVLDEWLIWTGETGWQQIPVKGDKPPARFGAVMITDSKGGVSGVLVGGMTSAGRVLNDFWQWTLEPDMTLVCKNVTTKATAFLKSDGCILGRFGAQLVRSNRGILMIGGITGARMLTRQDEILNMKTLRPQPIQGPRPLLVGHTVQDVDGGLIVLGGGATCFSFGTTWNRSCILNDAEPGKFDMEWRLQATVPAVKSVQGLDGNSSDTTTAQGQPNGTSSPPGTSSGIVSSGAGLASKIPEAAPIHEVNISRGLNFPQYVSAGRPVTLRKCHLGPCLSTWTNSHLIDQIGSDRQVSVHVCDSSSNGSVASMDFQSKNFSYQTQGFGTFLSAVERGEKVYLRSLSKENPSSEPTQLSDDFPAISSEFVLPDELEYVSQHAHSSPLRISGPVQMWLHYDVMANVYCQIRGQKKIRLFPPSDVTNLGFEPGSTTSRVDVFSDASYPGLGHTHPHQTVLEPGDILFIPPLWLHATAPVLGDHASGHPTPHNSVPHTNGTSHYEPSIAVNVFFRNLSNNNSYAAGRDVYGNRDLAAYEKGRKDIAKILKTFENLPGDVARFYLDRLGAELQSEGRRLQNLDSQSGQQDLTNGSHSSPRREKGKQNVAPDAPSTTTYAMPTLTSPSTIASTAGSLVSPIQSHESLSTLVSPTSPSSAQTETAVAMPFPMHHLNGRLDGASEVNAERPKTASSAGTAVAPPPVGTSGAGASAGNNSSPWPSARLHDFYAELGQ
ncbi:hypothetical protein CKM354_000462500 [Cercospora kikuchii]|uniref:tRNA wybutosine-synthesizing protein 4 n=1 Tax=Cercospora kikuchii TaxID=84275 RepID=A0A9P3CH73_9PEZI|nr:tRNA methyltransferase PPM2 [Cercospora kikuchii]GIZ41317.1 hypothetical protein CKM354_000462500 [Cercospora kikuchii]